MFLFVTFSLRQRKSKLLKKIFAPKNSLSTTYTQPKFI